MDEPFTEELLDELLVSSSPESFLERNRPVERNLSEYLNELLQTYNMERKDVIKAAHLDTTYGYQLFKGTRTNPSRDKVLQLAFGFGLTLRETDRLLQAAGASRLYCKDRRDAIIIFCLDRNATLVETNDILYQYQEPIIE